MGRARTQQSRQVGKDQVLPAWNLLERAVGSQDVGDAQARGHMAVQAAALTGEWLQVMSWVQIGGHSWATQPSAPGQRWPRGEAGAVGSGNTVRLVEGAPGAHSMLGHRSRWGCAKVQILILLL